MNTKEESCCIFASLSCALVMDRIRETMTILKVSFSFNTKLAGCYFQLPLSPIMTDDHLFLAQEFIKVLDDPSISMIIAANGGTGTARLTQGFAMKAGDSLLHDVLEDKKDKIVMGSSDGFILPFLAWLRYGIKNTYYGPNASDTWDWKCWSRTLRSFKRSLSSLNYSSAVVQALEISNSILDNLCVVPICAGPLIQSSLEVRELLCQRLRTEPHLLLIEDAFEQSNSGMLAVYEAVSALMPEMLATSAGGGAIALSSLLPTNEDSCPVFAHPLNFFPSCLSVPIIYGLDFGHINNNVSPIRFGERWRIAFTKPLGTERWTIESVTLC